MKKTEISIQDVLRIMYRRKWIIIASVLTFILIGLLYNIFARPVFESSVLLKKEATIDNQDQQDRLQNLLALRTQDELETEMQLVKTRNVIDKVIYDLSLNIYISEIIKNDGTVLSINQPLIEYKNRFNVESQYPRINDLKFGIKTSEAEYEIVFNNIEEYQINNIKNAEIPEEGHQINNDALSNIIDVTWPNNSPGKIKIKTIDYNELFEDLSTDIEVNNKIKTNIFEIIARSNYSYSSRIIADKLAEKFQENRITLQKENIRSTFKFIDERLNEVSAKLSAAEDNLSKFKSNEKIVQIDEQSKSLVEFISNLESEKLANSLEQILYNNKINNIEKQMAKGSYVDQTYLTPEQYQNISSPFSTLINELSALELRKLVLMQKRTEVHPDVVILTEQIEEIKSKLSHFNKNTITAYRIIANSLSEKEGRINSLISEYQYKIEELPEQEAKLASLIRERDAYDKMYTLLLDKREEMRLADLSRMQDIIVLDKAVEPIKPIAPHTKLNLLFAALSGMLIGLFGVVILHISDKKIADIKDIENSFNYPILTVIPPFENTTTETIKKGEIIKNRFVTMMEDNFRYKEAFRSLEIKLSSKVNGKPKTLMVTSCEENAGKTTIASELAITIAQSNKKVLLIDCDIKAPMISEKFGLPPFSSGLIDYLTGKIDSPNIYKPIKLTRNSNLLMNLDILPTGNFANISGEILASPKMEELLDKMEYYDFIVLDTPPIGRLADALSLSRLVKDTVLVVRSGQTIKESVSWAISELKTSDINFHGLVVNDCEVQSNDYKYQYGYTKK